LSRPIFYLPITSPDVLASLTVKLQAWPLPRPAPALALLWS